MHRGRKRATGHSEFRLTLASSKDRRAVRAAPSSSDAQGRIFRDRNSRRPGTLRIETPGQHGHNDALRLTATLAREYPSELDARDRGANGCEQLPRDLASSGHPRGRLKSTRINTVMPNSKDH